MIRSRTKLVVFFMACLPLHPAIGQSPSWSGTWNLESDSQQSKPEISFIPKSDGTYALASSTVVSRFRCDGKTYPMLSRAGQSGVGDALCKSLTKTALDIVYLRSDRHQTVGHLQVSGDGKGLTYTLETADSSGKKEIKVKHFARLSGTDGLVGDWRNIDPNPSQKLNVALSKQMITLDFPIAHLTTTYPLSGAETHATTNGAPSKGTATLQFVDAHTFRLANLQAGTVIGRAIYSLSLDGNMITERFWLEQHPEELAQYTYRRTH